jgi:hypothetical protein
MAPSAEGLVRDEDVDERYVPRALPVPVGRSPSELQRDAAVEVELLVQMLEPTLDPYQRRLLHQLRLAAETYGAIRAATGLHVSALR